jgi:hypothetical protein
LEQRKYFSPKRPVWLPTTNCHVCLIDDWWHISFIFFAIAVAPNFCFSLAAAPQSEVAAVWNKHALRENRVCRAFYFGRTTKRLFAVRFLQAAWQRKNARQTSYLPCAWKKRTTKILFAVRFLHDPRQSILSPFPLRTNETCFLKLCRAFCPQTHGKPVSLLCVFARRTTNYVFTLKYFPQVPNLVASQKISRHLKIFFNSIHKTCDTSCWNLVDSCSHSLYLTN